MRKVIVPNTYDYDGEFRPEKNPEGSYTFSVGIFRWVTDGEKIRRGKVIYRVRGYSPHSKMVYRRASQLCEAFDKEPKDWKGPRQKSEWVKG